MKQKTISPYQQTFRQTFILFWLCIGTLIFVSCWTFDPMDASFLTKTWSAEGDIVSPKNKVGWLGAQVSAPLFYVFGDFALIFALCFFVRAWQLSETKQKPNSTLFMLYWSAFLVFASLFLNASNAVDLKLGHWALVIKEHLRFWLGDSGFTIMTMFFALVFLNLTVNINFKTLTLPSKVLFRVLGCIRAVFRALSLIITRTFKSLVSNSRTTLAIFSLPLIRAIQKRAYRKKIESLEQAAIHRWQEQPQTKTKPLKTRGEIREADKDTVKNPEIKAKYTAPPPTLFRRSGESITSPEEKKIIDDLKAKIIQTFAEFGISGSIVDVQPGPVVTVYCFRAKAGTKLSKILGLSDDLALSLRLESIIIQPMTGTNSLGIQIPNLRRQQVLFGDLIHSSEFNQREEPLLLALGCSMDGTPQYADLSAMPHLLVAGATGSGKSVAIHSFLCSLILRKKPEDVKFILVDPKMLELSVYSTIPHLMLPVITDATKAAASLRWAIHEMDRRYSLMQQAKVRDISSYNRQVNKQNEEDKLPYIVIVIDELADLMLVSPKEVETSIQRLAQKARACGIHLILATQRPSVDVITGVIKANLPCRISFQVVSKHDSRTILDQMGSEKLLGKGDCLWNKPGGMKLERLQCSLILDEEVDRLVTHLNQQYPDRKHDLNVAEWIESHQEKTEDTADYADMSIDEKFEQAVDIANQQGSISASYLQRQLKIGYNRAARIVEAMDERGWLAPSDGVKARKWLGRSNSID